MKALAAMMAAPLLTACGGVSFQLDASPPPRIVALLPFAGSGTLAERDEVRALLLHRLRDRGLDVVAGDVVDQRLAEAGWLRDPRQFDIRSFDVGDVCDRLGVEALVLGSEFGSSSFNVLLLRRQSFGGELAIVRRDGTRWWHACHTTSSTGGFLLQSGQVFSELQAQGHHGTPMQTLALLDRFVDEVLDTLPAGMGGRTPPEVPALERVAVQRSPRPGGGERLTVTASAPSLAAVWFDLEPGVQGVPMARVANGFVGAQDLPAGIVVASVRVRARSGLGGPEATVVVRP